MARAVLVAMGLMLAAGAAPAADIALLIGNSDYRRARDLAAGTEILRAAAPLEAAGFRVIRVENGDAAALRAAAAEANRAADGSGRVVIALAGHFVRSESGTWFLGTDAARPDLIAAAAEGLSLEVLAEIAARSPGRAVILLGSEEQRIDLGVGLNPGIGAVAAPQGVAVIAGDARRVAEFAAGALPVGGRSLLAALERYPDLSAEGFVTDALPFLPAGPSPEPMADAGAAERAAFAFAERADTQAAWEEFLRLYPDGPNAAAARAALARLAETPEARARRIEEALGLGRDRRREIQRELTLLNYDTRGIDGIFGPGTRSAIAAWQGANGYDATGYLTADQITRLGAQAARRAAELEAEAAARQAEIERQDRAYWAETGAKGDEAGYRAYLRRYPDGLFAEVATARLAEIEAARAAEAAAADRAAWDRARAADTVAAYRAYLAGQPRGAFRAQAEARIAELTAAPGPDLDAARAEEQALGLNPFTRNLIEARLAALGLEPGRVDGSFDADTRRAIRRYQTARGLPVTGFLTQATVARLLADAVGLGGGD
jgi:peptidoglycan hydrolase-like protein with peptidoglycan-binding domain